MALEEQVVDKLIEKNYKISFAESCTGGLCCGTIVNVTNASKVLDMSFVTYANEAKIELLGVKADTILSHGVVSEEV
ncbi:MAG: CinA family protein, partial [Eubacterium sp.]